MQSNELPSATDKDYLGAFICYLDSFPKAPRDMANNLKRFLQTSLDLPPAVMQQGRMANFMYATQTGAHGSFSHLTDEADRVRYALMMLRNLVSNLQQASARPLPD